MQTHNIILSKIYTTEKIIQQSNLWKKKGLKVVFTNGCFDLVHKGHIEILSKSSDLGNKLIVGLNSDISIKKIKGKDRPIIDEKSRAFLLASISFIDAVVLFNEDTPLNLISSIRPDVLVKGGDYNISEIVGQNIVKKNDGEIVLIPFVDGFLSTGIIDKIKNS